MEKFEQAGRQQNRLAWLSGINSGVSLLLTNLTLLMILWAAIPLVSEGALSGVSLAVITLVVLAAFEAVTPMQPVAQTFNASRSAAQRLFSIGAADSAPKATQKTMAARSVRSIRFEDVTFSHQMGEEPVLQDITFELRPERRIAIVGASGAGKTSILNLLLAFQRPSMGQIYLDDLDTRDVEPDDIRSIFSVLPQQTHLFNDDVRLNLLLANPEGGDEELYEAISRSGLSGWLESLPNGLESWIGERGVKLSCGERQRLALARLFLQDRPYILLDEPTSNLDQMTAVEVMKNLFSWSAEKGMLLISHELKWLPEMDEILLLDGSRIVERGNFTELMTLKGRFTRLYNAEKERLVEG